MKIDKPQIIELLKERGQQAQADKAEQNLSDEGDTDQHGGLLAQHGLSAEDLIGKLGGGQGLGKLL